MRRRPTLISGAALNCGGPFSRLPAALASLKLGVGELGGFTGSGTRRLGPPALFPEPGATPPAPTGAVALGSFLWRTDGRRLRGGSRVGFADWTWSQGWLRCLRAIPLEMPLLSTVITSSSLLT